MNTVERIFEIDTGAERTLVGEKDNFEITKRNTDIVLRYLEPILVILTSGTVDVRVNHNNKCYTNVQAN